MSDKDEYKWYDSRMEQENKRYNERWERFLKLLPVSSLPLLYVFGGLTFRNLPPLGSVTTQEQVLYLKVAGTILLVGAALLSFAQWKTMRWAVQTMFELDAEWRTKPQCKEYPPLMGGTRKFGSLLHFDELDIPCWVIVACIALTVVLWLVP